MCDCNFTFLHTCERVPRTQRMDRVIYINWDRYSRAYCSALLPGSRTDNDGDKQQAEAQRARALHTELVERYAARLRNVSAVLFQYAREHATSDADSRGGGFYDLDEWPCIAEAMIGDASAW